MAGALLWVVVAAALTTAPPALPKYGCAPCHTKSDPGHKPKALAVFDLDSPGWAKRLSEPRVEKVSQRLKGKGATADELAEVARYLADERK